MSFESTAVMATVMDVRVSVVCTCSPIKNIEFHFLARTHGGVVRSLRGVEDTPVTRTPCLRPVGLPTQELGASWTMDLCTVPEQENFPGRCTACSTEREIHYDNPLPTREGGYHNVSIAQVLHTRLRELRCRSIRISSPAKFPLLQLIPFAGTPTRTMAKYELVTALMSPIRILSLKERQER